MLIDIAPLLGPDLRAGLSATGHGDEITFVDGNYPALEHGRRMVRADGHSPVPVLDVVLQVLPLDFVPEALFRSTVGPDVQCLYAIHAEMLVVCARRLPDFAIVPLDGQAFCDRVRTSHIVVATDEPALYANIIVRKGVIHPPAGSPT
jgi:L-fucose mutarotase